MAWSDRTTYQGKKVNEGTKALLKAANTILSSSAYGGENEDVTMVQGGYNKGGVTASAGTHDGGGAFDLTPYNWRNRVKVFRILGVALWHRPAIRGLWGEHLHGIVCGDGTASAGARAQVTEYYEGGDGLVGGAHDPDWRPKTLPILFHLPTGSDLAVRYAKQDVAMRDQPSTKGGSKGTLKKGAKFTPAAMVKVGSSYWIINIQGRCVAEKYLTKTKPGTATTPAPQSSDPMHLRLGTFNLPGPDKLPNPDARIAAAVEQIKAANLHAVTFNELVGPGKDSTTNKPSEFAAAVAAALDWPILTPTTAWNENYIAINPRRARLSKQFDDVKIYAKVGDRAVPGRHLTPAVLVDLETGRGFFLGATHLVNNDEAGAAAQAVLVMAAARKIASTRWPIFISGDMNTDQILTGFTRDGLANARIHAKAVTNAKNATYVNYSKTKPSTDADWIIDQLYSPHDWTVDGYTVLIPLTASGELKKPRASDHFLTIAAFTEPA
jgi:hypothetical protein